MPKGTSECGTPWAVARHLREGTDPCPEDREELRAYKRRWAAERKRRRARRAAEATRRAQQADPGRESLEASVLAAHEAGELTLG